MNTVRGRSRTADAAAWALMLVVVGVATAVIGPQLITPARVPVGAVVPSTITSSSLPAPPAPLPEREVRTVRIIMTVDDQITTATLADTPAAHQLAAMLPVTLNLKDAFGQAKVGALPRPIDITGAAREIHPATGGIYYWTDGADLAVFYDALGQAVPAPGLIRLGRIDTGLDTLASRGNVTVTIRRAE